MSDDQPLQSNSLPVYMLIVGLMDVCTGVLLVADPGLVLRLMLIGAAPTDTVWLRFIGAFVAGVGSIYLYPLVVRAERRADLRWAALEFSALVRTSVGLLVVGAVSLGALAPAWISVALTDLGLAGLQVIMLARRRNRSGAVA